jgi:hypothetical protein
MYPFFVSDRCGEANERILKMKKRWVPARPLELAGTRSAREKRK